MVSFKSPKSPSIKESKVFSDPCNVLCVSSFHYVSLQAVSQNEQLAYSMYSLVWFQFLNDSSDFFCFFYLRLVFTCLVVFVVFLTLYPPSTHSKKLFHLTNFLLLFCFFLWFFVCLTACPPSTYKNFTGFAANCYPCPANSGHTKTGSISILDCKCFEGYAGNPHNGQDCSSKRTGHL